MSLLVALRQLPLLAHLLLRVHALGQAAQESSRPSTIRAHATAARTAASFVQAFHEDDTTLQQ